MSVAPRRSARLAAKAAADQQDIEVCEMYWRRALQALSVYRNTDIVTQSRCWRELMVPFAGKWGGFLANVSDRVKRTHQWENSRMRLRIYIDSANYELEKKNMNF